MGGWHHQLNGHEFEQALGDAEEGSLACCSLWGRKESDMTDQLNKSKKLRLGLLAEIIWTKNSPPLSMSTDSSWQIAWGEQ